MNNKKETNNQVITGRETGFSHNDFSVEGNNGFWGNISSLEELREKWGYQYYIQACALAGNNPVGLLDEATALSSISMSLRLGYAPAAIGLMRSIAYEMKQMHIWGINISALMRNIVIYRYIIRFSMWMNDESNLIFAVEYKNLAEYVMKMIVMFADQIYPLEIVGEMVEELLEDWPEQLKFKI